MATDRQIQANRLNALKSTGPRSVEGKAVSSQNALKSGIDAASQIIRGEDPATLAALTEQYFLDYQPQSAAGRAMVDFLIDAEWTLRRLRHAETTLWNEQLVELEGYHNRWNPDHPVAKGDMAGSVFQTRRETFTRLERRRDSLHRTFHRTLRDLRDLDAKRSQPEPDTPPTLCTGPNTRAIASPDSGGIAPVGPPFKVT